MNTTVPEGVELAKAVVEKAKDLPANVELVVAPPFTHLALVAEALKGSKVALSAQNCADHEKGAYTGANERFIGRFERADKGTLFLDEIGEISLSTQVKLLRVLETRNLERVGGSTTIPVDVRLIAATNRDLKAMTQKGTFREDLFYRLNVVNLQLPPLREHREDIQALVEHYLQGAARDNGKTVTGISAEALDVLQSYNWPGNIRELRNCVERMVVLSRSNILTINDIPREVVDAVAAQFDTEASGEKPASPEGEPDLPRSDSVLPPSEKEKEEVPIDTLAAALDIHATEKAAIEKALAKCNGNRTHAAEALGISRRTLQRKLKQYALEDAVHEVEGTR